jgi:beta-glucanase (GH16 family)
MTRSHLLVLSTLLLTAMAQTFTTCNPLSETCGPQPAFGNQREDHDFAQGACPNFVDESGTPVSYGSQGAQFSIKTEGHSPTIASSKFIFFGRVEVDLMASPGQGVVTAVVLQSADLDEIDWEWLGGDNTQVQSNYFGKGDTASYDRGAFHPVDQPTSRLHSYVIDWNPQRIEWIIDGTVVRTLNYKDAQGGTRYPQTPMQVKLGTWCAGLPNSPKGTVEWAGGYTNFALAPFDAWYQSITVIDYCGGSAACTEDVQQYVYGDRSGSMQSIQVVP